MFGVGVAVALSGCGQSITLAHRQVGIALSEYRLRPDHIVAPAGTLTVTLENVGRLSHNLVVSRDIPTTTVLTTATATRTGTTTVAARSGDLAPGATATLTVSLRPGRYQLASTVDADRSLGAEGTLTVTSK